MEVRMNQETYPSFGKRDKIGYMIGNIANDLTFIFASLYLQIFYTDVLGISAALVGTMFLLARIVDAFTDTIMGRIADKTRASKGGKFKPWLLRICGPVAIASFLMYQSSIADASMVIKITYMFATYLLWGSVFYTAINIPYGSMASVLTADADERAALSTFRGIGSVFPQLIIGVILPIFLFKTLDDGRRAVNAEAFPVSALILAVIAAAAYVTCYYMCTERVKPRERGDKLSFKESVKTLFSCRALISICAVFVLFLSAQMLSQTISNYIFKDYFSDTSGITVMNAAGFLPLLSLAPLAVPLSRRFGKKEIGVLASFLGAAACALLFFLKTKNMWVYIVINITGLLGFGLFNLIIWAFISDVIDDHELHSGVRQDGMIYAICSFSRKLGQAIASAVGAWSLAWVGYTEGSQIGQTEEVKNGIYGIATAVPAVLYLAVGLILLFLYPLGKRRVLDNTAKLKAKKQENGEVK